MDLDAVMGDLDFDSDNATSNITNPEEARAETQKVVNLLEQLLLSSDDDADADADAGADAGVGADADADTGAGAGAGAGAGTAEDGDDSLQTKASSAEDDVPTSKANSNKGDVDQVQQPGMSSQTVSTTAMTTTVAPTRAPMTLRQIKRANVSHQYLFF